MGYFPPGLDTRVTTYRGPDCEVQGKLPDSDIPTKTDTLHTLEYVMRTKYKKGRSPERGTLMETIPAINKPHIPTRLRLTKGRSSHITEILCGKQETLTRSTRNLKKGGLPATRFEYGDVSRPQAQDVNIDRKLPESGERTRQA